MNFRKFIVARRAAPHTDISTGPHQRPEPPRRPTGPSEPKMSRQDDPRRLGHSGDTSDPGNSPPVVRSDEPREPDEMGNQMSRAAQLARELGKTLVGLPPPWNKMFHRYLEVLRSLTAKLQEIA